MNSEYENSSQPRKTLQELKQINRQSQTRSGEPEMQSTPIVIQCPLPEALTMLTQRAECIQREVCGMREYLPNLSGQTDLTVVQESMTQMQKSLAEMTALLKQAGKKKERRICKWLAWLPDFDLTVVTKWIVLAVLVAAALLGMVYGTATVIGNIRELFTA